ncbi:MAG: protein-export chaperone SecB [Clostridia bacterium]|nr:protein-export chaperone SecB [Clostridia bacterium]
MDNTKESNFQYTNPRITKFSYIFTELSDGQWEITMKHKKKVEKLSENEAKVVLDMIICASEDPSPFEFSFSVEANFRWKDFDAATVSSLLSRTAPSLLVGYARPIVAMFTNSSGIMPFNIPMIDFTKESIVDFSEL